MQLIEHWGNHLKVHNVHAKNFLAENNDLANEYRKSKKDRSEIGFNVFTLASDLYYRENFHSYIFASFLNPNEKHFEENKYLHLFIDLLNKNDKPVGIKKDDFRNSEVYVEKHKIDILITDESSKKAIIIENKINNAVDQYRQLPRYVEIVQKEYDIVAIVYLTLNSAKRPDKTDWTSYEDESIKKTLKLIPVFDTNSNKTTLHKDWVLPSILISQNINNSSILRQYGELLKYLNTNTMDTITLKKFYDTIQSDPNLETAISIRDMLNDLPQYLAHRIEDKYKEDYHPFLRIWRHKSIDVVFEGFKINGNYFKLDIWCFENKYVAYFWESETTEFDIKDFCNRKVNAVADFVIHNNQKNNLTKSFSTLKEPELFNFIDQLLSELKALMTDGK